MDKVFAQVLNSKKEADTMNTRNQITSLLKIAVGVIAAAGLTAVSAYAGTITKSPLADETDIVNTGSALVSACDFGLATDPDMDINGIVHPTGSANGAGLTVSNVTGEGDWNITSASAHYPAGSDMLELMEGFAMSDSNEKVGPIVLNISGLTIGKQYLFQGYWDNGQSLNSTFSVTCEGDTLENIKYAGDNLGTLISYTFIATKASLDVSMIRTGGEVWNKPWWQGYCLQEVSLSTSEITISPLTDETDIVNTGFALVSACDFSADLTDPEINGIVHTSGSANVAGLTVGNWTAEGDWFGGYSTYYTGDLAELMHGFAMSDFNDKVGPIELNISGLTIGKKYLFQGYWDSTNNADSRFSVTFEGTDTQGGITRIDDQGALISYTFIAGDTSLDADMIKASGATWDKPWWQGYCLQEAEASSRGTMIFIK